MLLLLLLLFQNAFAKGKRAPGTRLGPVGAYIKSGWSREAGSRLQVFFNNHNFNAGCGLNKAKIVFPIALVSSMTSNGFLISTNTWLCKLVVPGATHLKGASFEQC